MARKVQELRATAESLLQDSGWTGAPRSQLARLNVLDKGALASLVAEGQIALQRAREREHEATWARASCGQGCAAVMRASSGAVC